MTILRPGAPLAAWQVWPRVGSQWPTYNIESDQADGLVFWMPFNAHIGTMQFTDVVRNTIMTLGGTPTWTTMHSTLGWGLYFASASSEYLEAATSALLFSAMPCSVVAWGVLDSPNDWSTYYLGGVTDPDAGFSRGAAIRVGTRASAASVRFAAHKAGGAAETGDLPIPAGTIYHVAGIFSDNAAGDFSVYAQGGIYSASTTGADSTPNCDTIDIGCSYFDAARASYWQGRIFDFRVYNRALTISEVAQQYDRDTRWHLHQIPRRVWAVEAAVARRIFITHC